MWGDRGQYVVTTQHEPLIGVKQAQVILGVPGGVQREPASPGKRDAFIFGETNGGSREWKESWQFLVCEVIQTPVSWE
jgi:hypothetical protein